MDYTNLCRKTLEGWLGVTIPDDDIKVILEIDPEYPKELEEAGYEIDADGMDTYDREGLFDGVAKFLGYDHWPMYCEMYEEWSIEFNNAIAKKIEDGEWKVYE